MESHEIARLKRLYSTRKSSTERTNFERQWQDISEVISPRTYDFIGTRTPGEKRTVNLVDSTGIHANEMLAAGLHGMATNPASRWFSLRMVLDGSIDQEGKVVDINKDDVVQRYLAALEETIWQRLYQPGTNFATALHEVYLDLGAFGTACLFIGARNNGELLFEAVPLSTIVIAENADGKIDSVMRKIKYTVRQMVEMAETDGWEISDNVREKFQAGNEDEAVEVIHAIYKRLKTDPKRKDRKNMPYASVYFEMEGKEDKCLEESGELEFPYAVARWSRVAGEVYGRSPGMIALPDVKMLQAMEIATLKAGAKMNDPPLVMRDDGILGPVRLTPGGLTYWRGNPNEGIMQLPVSGNLPFTVEMTELLRNRIRTTFFTDVLQFVTDAKMTATEVMQRTQERMRLMGPLLGRLEGEMLGPLVARVYSIMLNNNMLPKPPEIVQERQFSVEYVSPIATAQKQNAAAGMMQVWQIMSPFGPDIAAQIAQKEIDVSKMFRWAWDLFNCDPELLRSPEDTEADNEKAEAMQALQMGGPAMDMVAKGAGAVKQLGDTQAGGGMDLGVLLQALTAEAKNNPALAAQMQGMLSGPAPQRALPPPGRPDPSAYEDLDNGQAVAA